MTLASVRDMIRSNASTEGPDHRETVEAILRAFEADPQFKLPERVEALAKTFDLPALPRPGPEKLYLRGLGGEDRIRIARRLRDLLEANP